MVKTLTAAFVNTVTTAGKYYDGGGLGGFVAQMA